MEIREERGLRGANEGRLYFFMFALVTIFGCGGLPETLLGFDVELKTVSHCSQVGSGAPQCEDETKLSEIVERGNWTIEDKGGNTFVLTDEKGRVFPGQFLPIEEEGWLFEVNLFENTVDVNSGCELNQRNIIQLIYQGEKIEGDIIEERIGGSELEPEICDAPWIKQIIKRVNGKQREEAVVARTERLIP